MQNNKVVPPLTNLLLTKFPANEKFLTKILHPIYERNSRLRKREMTTGREEWALGN